MSYIRSRFLYTVGHRRFDNRMLLTEEFDFRNLGSMYWHGQGCIENRELAMDCLEAVQKSEKSSAASPVD